MNPWKRVKKIHSLKTKDYSCVLHLSFAKFLLDELYDWAAAGNLKNQKKWQFFLLFVKVSVYSEDC